MALMYRPNPVINLADDDGTLLLTLVPSDLALTTGDLFDFRRQAEEVGLRLLVVESVAVDSKARLEDEIVWAARRHYAAATAPRSVRGLRAKGTSYMDDLSIHLRIADGINDGINDGEPFGTLTPEAMAQRLRFRLTDYDRQREVSTGQQENVSRMRPGAVVRLHDRRSGANRLEDKAGPDNRLTAQDAEYLVEQTEVTQVQEPEFMVGDHALTDAARLANANPVSLSELVAKCCHSTALTDGVRAAER